MSPYTGKRPMIYISNADRAVLRDLKDMLDLPLAALVGKEDAAAVEAWLLRVAHDTARLMDKVGAWPTPKKPSEEGER
jgi:hypothetical protein